MNVLMVLPQQHHFGGNWVHATRLQKGLASDEVRVAIKTMDQVTEQDVREADMLHAFNAYSTGRALVPLAEQQNKRLLVTLTGTDINEHIDYADRRIEMKKVFDYASGITVLTTSAKEKLTRYQTHWANKITVIPIGVEVPPTTGLTREAFGVGAGNVVFLLVAGIRTVKRPLHAFPFLKKIQAVHKNVRFLVAGPIHDEALHQQMIESFEDTDFARYLGSVPHHLIPDLYQCADVVLNTSSSEGLSHSLIEAMQLNRPVLASAVAGNRDLIVDGVNGFLYDSEEAFIHKALRLLNDQTLSHMLAANAKDMAQTRYSVQAEVEAFRERFYSTIKV